MIRAFLMICFRTVLRICYLPFRLLKPRNKIVFLSRQVNTPSMDFTMLADEIHRISPETEIVILCKTIGKSFKGKISYFFHMFSQMFHLATSKAALLDGYCITACVLKHHKELKIYQMWHALGLLKNFAYTALGNSEGTTAKTAEIMCMHRGYHKILCSSEELLQKIAKCYDAPAKKMFPIGLPRIDFLTSNQMLETKKKEILDIYPALSNGKPNILYVPTLRKNKDVSADSLISAIDLTKYNFIIKKHDGFEKVLTETGTFSNITDFTGLEWISAANYVITDYSAILFEAMVAKRPVFLYCYDRKTYDVVRGFATDYNSIPAVHCETPNQLITSIEDYTPNYTETEKFLDIHVSARKLHTTKTLGYVITEEMKGKNIEFKEILKDYSLQNRVYELK